MGYSINYCPICNGTDVHCPACDGTNSVYICSTEGHLNKEDTFARYWRGFDVLETLKREVQKYYDEPDLELEELFWMRYFKHWIENLESKER